jgi:hypothetical protein
MAGLLDMKKAPGIGGRLLYEREKRKTKGRIAGLSNSKGASFDSERAGKQSQSGVYSG